MKYQMFFLGIVLSLGLFISTTPPCLAMEADPTSAALAPASSHPWIGIFDLFWVLFRVDQKQAESDIVSPATPRTPSSPVFHAEATMRANRWQDMDLGRATKEHVAEEARAKGQDFASVVRYIENIGTWVKPIQLGMDLYRTIRATALAALLLSNISVYCLSGLKEEDYFPRINTACGYTSPNIFADARETAEDGFPYCEGYSCTMGLGKPDVLCYLFFLVLNCPDVPKEEKIKCLEIQKLLLHHHRQKFEAEDKIEHATQEKLSPAQTRELSEEIHKLEDQIVILRRQLTELIEDIKRRHEALNAFSSHCFFIDDSPRNLVGAEKAGIYPVSCQCHAVAYWTIVKRGIIERSAEYEALLNYKAPGHLAYFEKYALEELHDYDRIDDDLYGTKERDSRGIILRNQDGSPRRISPPKVAPVDYT